MNNSNHFSTSHSTTLKGPAQSASDIKKVYEPVSCDFTDELEMVTVKKIPVELTYFDENEKSVNAQGLIKDIFTKDKEEFVKLDDEKLIRLDRISEVKMINH